MSKVPVQGIPSRSCTGSRRRSKAVPSSFTGACNLTPRSGWPATGTISQSRPHLPGTTVRAPTQTCASPRRSESTGIATVQFGVDRF